jgi:hypothetical protein
MDAKMQDLAQITIEAIRKEYTLTLARLQLSRDFPELAGNGEFRSIATKTPQDVADTGL